MSSVHQIPFLSKLKASIFIVHLTCTLETNTALSYNTPTILLEIQHLRRATKDN